MKNKGKKLFGAVVMMLMIALMAMPVSAAPKLSKKTVSVTVGKTIKLKVKKAKGKKIKWSSSKKSIATVSQKGVVKAKKPGTVKITAKVGKKKLRCKVTVRKNEYVLSRLDFSNPSSSGFELIPTNLYYSNGSLVCKVAFYNYNSYTLRGFQSAYVQLRSGSKLVAHGTFTPLNMFCYGRSSTTGTLTFSKNALPKKKVDLGAIKGLYCSCTFGTPVWY